MNILVFSLGKKGFNVVRAIAESGLVNSVYCVIGKDAGIDDDYSSKLMSFCDHHNITYCFREDFSPNAANYDLFLAVGWRWIVRDVPEKKLVVFHDSLLPQYRGFSPLVNAMINREPVVGVTALLGAKDYDRGDILLQKSMNISYPTTIANEIDRVSILYGELALELFSKLKSSSIDMVGYPQDEKNATYSLWRDEEDYRINWSDTASNIEHFISCVSEPYKGASAILRSSVIRVFKSRLREDVRIENRQPGKIIFVENGLPVIVCGTGLLTLSDVRDEFGLSILPLKYFRSRFC